MNGLYNWYIQISKMKNLFVQLFTMCIILFGIPVSGYSQEWNSQINNYYQELYTLITKEYKSDQVLVNGLYYDNYYRNAIGHPFLFEDVFYKGKLFYQNMLYKDLDMKYDIYEQRLLIRYILNDHNIIFIPPNEFISEFSFNEKHFKKYPFPGTAPKFYQVIADYDNIKCLCYWFKKRAESSHSRSFSSYRFYNSEKRCSLVLNNKLLNYRSNASFIRYFPEMKRDKIRKYLKSKKIKVLKSNDNTIRKLIDYCHKCLNQNN
jgi:hypothetical protein